MELAGQLFAQDTRSNREEFVIFSDMRESIAGLDFEHAKLAPPFSTVIHECGSIPYLRGVDTYVLDAGGPGESLMYMQSLRIFWSDYFQYAGAILETFSVLSTMPDLR